MPDEAVNFQFSFEIFLWTSNDYGIVIVDVDDVAFNFLLKSSKSSYEGFLYLVETFNFLLKSSSGMTTS